MARPRLTENEFNHYQLKKFFDKKLYKIIFFSDPHGWLADLKVLRCINQVLKHNQFDEVCINGDIVDMPYVSKHTQHLFDEGILSGYTEIGEIEYTKEQILKPLRLSTDGVIRVRTGNHDQRITKPYLLGDKQLAKLAVLYKNYNTTEFQTMLGLQDGFVYDPSDVFTYFEKFDVTHGLSLAKNASEKNIMEYMSSGTTGHTHRLNSKYVTNRKAPYVWYESGCTRIIEQVEYLPTGKIADWQNGFLSVVFYQDGDKIRFYGQAVPVIESKCYYNGVLYSGD